MTKQLDNQAAEQLANVISEIERLEKVGRINRDQITEQFQFAKDKGYDVAVIRKILKDRKLSERRKEKLKTEDELVDLYKSKIEEVLGQRAIKELVNS